VFEKSFSEVETNFLRCPAGCQILISVQR